MLAETVGIRGHEDDLVEAYAARPMAPGPRGGVIVIHHRNGHDRESKEAVRTLAVMGYNAICVNLYSREAPGASPDDAAAAVRARGGVPDGRFVGDAKGAARWLRDLPASNGKAGAIGFCSGGRHALLASMEVDLQAAVDCYGAFVIEPPPPDYPTGAVPLAGRIAEVGAPLLGLFGNEDTHPLPEHVDRLEKLLQEHGKTYEFQRYDGAGHAFFSVDRPAYRPEAAVDGWRRVRDFFAAHLGS